MTEAAFALASPRLRLRPVTRQDVPALHRHWTDPEVRRYLWDDDVISLEAVGDLVGQSERRFAAHGHGLWAIRERGAEAVVGCGGYWTFHEPPQLELVLSLSPACWGRGLATEAGRLLLADGFDRLGFDEVRASTDAPNAASLRLLERLGFSFSHRAEAGGLDTVFSRRAREEERPGGSG